MFEGTLESGGGDVGVPLEEHVAAAATAEAANCWRVRDMLPA